jgi:hypothetical protein
MREAAPSLGLHSLHANFLDADDLAAFDDVGPDDGVAVSGWLAREDVQFHWTRDPSWASFDDFTAALDHKRRKNLKADRRKVAEAGVRLRIVEGEDSRGAPLAAMHRFYRGTFAEKWNHAAMTEAFFQHLGTAMPGAVVLVLAERGGEAIGGALCLRSEGALYGRYWGATEDVPGLHFEACYHQGVAYCIERGIDRFEPGAQGEHKLARGFLPVATHSRHWLAEPRFHAALQKWCAAERASVTRYRGTLAEHSPFRNGAIGRTAPPGHSAEA